MDRITAALQAVEEQAADGAPVTLLAHSAGGWLSRVFLLEVRLSCGCNIAVAGPAGAAALQQRCSRHVQMAMLAALHR